MSRENSDFLRKIWICTVARIPIIWYNHSVTYSVRIAGCTPDLEGKLTKPARFLAGGGKMESERRKVLIVDDEDISCKVLVHILEKDYVILRAANGQEALDIIEKETGKISLVILDLIMPVMNGYQFLDIITASPRYAEIPVIVTTAKDNEEDEICCLEKGAVDFISKPYCPEVVKHRVDRIIRFKEASVAVDQAEHDRLTGLYNRETFYREAELLLAGNPEQQYDLIVADVENFKMVNERLGMKNGDRVLCYMAERYRELVGDEGICTRLHGDVFAMLVEHGDGSWKDRLLWQLEEVPFEFSLPVMVIKYGIYEKVNRAIEAYAMCDRAVLAVNRIKHLYGKNVAKYDDSLRAQLLREQRILDTMEQALKEHQFVVYYQPKYDISSDCISGAEALVRWNHPEYGFMSPAEFIPLFEKNGFITKLDFYVWEEVCRTLRRWQDEKQRPIAVSVNISRRDFDVPDLAEQIIRMADRHGIERENLHLEITESVYTDEPQCIIETVNKLREGGFKIEMDDFGSGYSSLTMLSDLAVDVLKLDMKFIQKNSDNGKNILGFVISLSKWLNLVTIAEGVETKEQVEHLKQLGCDYVQGYFYAKPMPEKEFERYRDEMEKKSARTAENKTKAGRREKRCLKTETGVKRTDTILVVEDSCMNREILRYMLEPYYYVEEVSNGKEACEYLQQHGDRISVILLDLMMPVMDGFQFMKKRAREKLFLDIPVIVTSEKEENSQLTALRLGASHFVGKPYQKELLLLSIQDIISRRGKA